MRQMETLEHAARLTKATLAVGQIKTNTLAALNFKARDIRGIPTLMLLRMGAPRQQVSAVDPQTLHSALRQITAQSSSAS